MWNTMRVMSGAVTSQDRARFFFIRRYRVFSRSSGRSFDTAYPAFFTALSSISRGISRSETTKAVSVARFTAANTTPSTFFRDRSTMREQVAQVIPVTVRLVLNCCSFVSFMATSGKGKPLSAKKKGVCELSGRTVYCFRTAS